MSNVGRTFISPRASRTKKTSKLNQFGRSSDADSDEFSSSSVSSSSATKDRESLLRQENQLLKAEVWKLKRKASGQVCRLFDPQAAPALDRDEVDRMMQENYDLEQQVLQLQQDNSQLRAQVSELTRKLEASQAFVKAREVEDAEREKRQGASPITFRGSFDESDSSEEENPGSDAIHVIFHDKPAKDAARSGERVLRGRPKEMNFQDDKITLLQLEVNKAHSKLAKGMQEMDTMYRRLRMLEQDNSQKDQSICKLEAAFMGITNTLEEDRIHKMASLQQVQAKREDLDMQLHKQHLDMNDERNMKLAVRAAVIADAQFMDIDYETLERYLDDYEEAMLEEEHKLGGVDHMLFGDASEDEVEFRNNPVHTIGE